MGDDERNGSANPRLAGKMKVEIDSFSQYKIYPGKGKLFVARDSRVYRFVNRKEESLFHHKKNPRKIAWTPVARRHARKGISEETAKKRSRRTVKAQRNQKPEVRNAARAAAVKDGKDKKKADRDAKAKAGPAGKAAIPKMQMAKGAGSKSRTGGR